MYCSQSYPAFVAYNGSIGIVGPENVEFLHLDEEPIAYSQIYRNNLYFMTLRSLYAADVSKPGSARVYEIPQQWRMSAITSLVILESEFDQSQGLSPFMIVTEDELHRIYLEKDGSIGLKSLKAHFAPIQQAISSPLNQLLLYTSPAGLVCCGINGSQRVISEGIGYWVKKEYAAIFMESLGVDEPAKIKLINAVKDEVSGKAGFKDKSVFELEFDSEVLLIDEKMIVLKDLANRICVHVIKNLMNKIPVVEFSYLVLYRCSALCSKTNQNSYFGWKTQYFLDR